MKNREYLLNTSPIDILKSANARMLWLSCYCILDTLDEACGRDRCESFDFKCDECLQKWLNEERTAEK